MDTNTKFFKMSMYGEPVGGETRNQVTEVMNDRLSTFSDVSHEELLHREIYLGSYTFNATSAEVVFRIPGALAADTVSYYGRIARFFALFRSSGFRFKFKLGGTQFHSGALIAYWQPATTYTRFDTDLTLMTEDSQPIAFPHVVIAASNIESAYLDVPWVNPMVGLYSYGTRAYAGADVGVLSVRPWSTFLAGTGASSAVTMTIWCEPKNTVMVVPTPFSGVYLNNLTRTNPDGTPGKIHGIAPDMSFRAVSLAGNAESRTSDDNVRLNVDRRIVHQVGTGILDAAAAYGVQKVRSMIATVPVVGDFLSKWLDKPHYRDPALPITRKSASSWMHGVGLTTATSLSVTPGLMRAAMADEIGKPFDLKEYIQTFGLVGDLNVPTATAAGAQLQVLPVYPMPQSFSHIAGAGGRPELYQVIHTPISFVGETFTWWRGGLRFRYEFYPPNLVNATFAAVWVPNITTFVGNYNSIASFSNAVVMEVRGNTTKHFDVGFASDQYMKSVLPSSWYNETAVPTYPWRDLYFSNGCICLFLVNTIAAPDNVPSAINIKISIAALPDFEFYLPHPTSISNIYSMWKYQAGDSGPRPQLPDPKPRSKRAISESSEFESVEAPIEEDLIEEVCNQAHVPRGNAVLAIRSCRQDGEFELEQYIQRAKLPLEHQVGEAVAEAGIAADGVEAKNPCEPVVPDEPLDIGPSMFVASVMGESTMALGSLLKRFQLLFTGRDVNSDVNDPSFATQVYVPVSPLCMPYTRIDVPPDGNSAVNQARKIMNLLYYYSSVANFWRGSLVYRIVIHAVGWTCKVVFYPKSGTWLYGGKQWNTALNDIFSRQVVPSTTAMNDYLTREQHLLLNSSNGGIELQVQNDGGVMEFIVPFMMPQPCLPCTKVNSIRSGNRGGVGPFTDSMQGYLIINFIPPSTGGTAIKSYNFYEVFVAAGDDFQLSYPTAPPVTYSYRLGFVP